MKTPQLDKNIKEKFNDRTLEPSASAWERLSSQLDNQEQKKKKGWFFYIGYAASILLIVSIGINLFSGDEKITPKQEIVDQPIDTNLIDKKIEKLFNEFPLEEAIVKNDKVEEKQEVKVDKSLITNRVKQPVHSKEKNKRKNKAMANNSISTKEELLKKTPNKENKIIIAKVEEKQQKSIQKNEEIKFKTPLKQNPNSRIKINSEDLLYAVTHSPEEVKTYYAKHNVSRDDVLKTIQDQLKKSNLKIDPNTILAEVERSIDDEDFQNNFLKSLKKKVTNIANAIASRND